MLDDPPPGLDRRGEDALRPGTSFGRRRSDRRIARGVPEAKFPPTGSAERPEDIAAQLMADIDNCPICPECLGRGSAARCSPVRPAKGKADSSWRGTDVPGRPRKPILSAEWSTGKAPT